MAGLPSAAEVLVGAVAGRLGYVLAAFTMDTRVHTLPTALEQAPDPPHRLVCDRAGVSLVACPGEIC